MVVAVDSILEVFNACVVFESDDVAVVNENIEVLLI